jgi:two-component system NtrC family response regulator
LLRFLQNKVIERVGGRTEIPVDVRIVAATNQDLDALIAQQRFRQDLFFRLSEVTVKVPPLRERRADVIALCNLYLQKFSQLHGRPKRGFTDEAVKALMAHPWPGNVRELENKVKSAVLLADDAWIGVADLGLKPVAGEDMPLNLREVRLQADRQAVQRAMAAANGSVSKAADLLGVSRPTLYDLLERLGITVNE